MKNGSMFGTLRKFYEDEVYEKAPYFWIYTPDKIYRYDIFLLRGGGGGQPGLPDHLSLGGKLWEITSMTLTAVP